MLGKVPLDSVVRILTSKWYAADHNFQGISNAPGTARVLSEIVMDGKALSVDLRKLQPSVFI